MLKSVLQKSFKNYFYSMISIASVTILGFIATPLIIQYVGKSQYGVYQLILQFLGYLILCDLGLTTSTRSILSEAWSKNDRKLVIKSIKLILKQYFKIIPLIIISISLICFIFLNFSLQSYDNEIVHSLLIMAFTALLMPFNVFLEFLNASERTHISSKLITVQLLLMTSLNIYFSYNGYGLRGLAVSYSFTIVTFQIITAILAFRRITHIPIKNLGFNIDEKFIWKLNAHSFIQNIFGRLSYTTDTIILSFFMPEAIITNFVTNQKLATIVDSLVKNVGNSSWASIATLRDNPKELQRAISLFNSLFLLLSVPLIFTLAYNNHDFIALWLGEDFYISDTFTWIAFGNFAVFGVLSFWSWMFLSLGKVEKQTKPIIISGIINITLSVLLTKKYGEVGPVLGTFIAFYGFYMWHLYFVMKKELDVSVLSFILKFTFLAPCFYGLHFLLKYILIFDGGTWIGLILNIAICYILGVVLSSLVVIQKKDLEWFKKWRNR